MGRRYAENTTVPVIKSRGEIERLLFKHKCSQFSTGVDNEQHRAVVQFKAYNRFVRFEIQLPNPSDKEFRNDRHGWVRTATAIQKAVEQAERQRWRALLLVIKAKLESVENDIATFEDEFLAHIVLPNRQTVGQVVRPLIEQAYASGSVPERMLGDGSPVDIDA